MKKNFLHKLISATVLTLSLIAATIPASTSKAMSPLSDYVTVNAETGRQKATITLYDGSIETGAVLATNQLDIYSGDYYAFDILLNEPLKAGYSFVDCTTDYGEALTLNRTAHSINISGIIQGNFSIDIALSHTTHVVDNWTTEKDATHTEAGLQKGTCKYCHETQTKEIPALGHDTEISEWSSDSDFHWHACSCGEALDKKAHTFGDWTITKEATTTEKGIKQRKCTICNYTESAEIAMIAAPSTKPTTTSTSTSPKASETGETKSASPKTGDNTNIILWSILALISISGVSVCVKRKLTK